MQGSSKHPNKMSCGAKFELLAEEALDRIAAGEPDASVHKPVKAEHNDNDDNPGKEATSNGFSRSAPLSCSTNETISGRIALLPQDVVDRIAAGEVVQKPVSAVKELLENSLDAGATEVCVSVEGQGYTKIIIQDNGCGIPREDLPLAAVRHATSKLQTLDDFDSLQSFGFRGEALASISMVSKLSICTRTADSKVGYTMYYIDGTPTPATSKPTARKVGTTVTVESLFYNLPHRTRKNNIKDDYSKILHVVQQYAILYAKAGVGLICERKGNHKTQNGTDLNTASSALLSQLRQSRERGEQPEILDELGRRATKEVISTVYGTPLFSNSEPFTFQSNNLTKEEEGHQQQQKSAPASLHCQGYISRPGYAGSKKTIMVLFVNQRLVESRQIQRRLEEVYADFTKSKPFLFLSLTVPPNTVDVNVHPTKREVTLFYFNEICQQLANQLRETISVFGQSFTMEGGNCDEDKNNKPKNTKRKRSELQDAEDPPQKDVTDKQTSTTKTAPESSKAKLPANKFIRTSRSTQSGALEPFLSLSQPSSQQPSLSQMTPSSTQASTVSPGGETPSPASFNASSSQPPHKPDCPLAQSSSANNSVSVVDMSQPGAFATVSSQCTCRRPPLLDEGSSNNYNALRLPRQAIVRPRRVPPTPCGYTSIRSLRMSVRSQVDDTVQEQLRNACFVGVVSHQRCLLQAGENLVLLNHYEAAQQLFYQLALDRFPGGAKQARMGQPIDVRAAVAHLAQFEELLHDSSSENTERLDYKINETNALLADQASLCLLEHASMLMEYFSIGIATSSNDDDNDNRILLTCLPVLLENYTPYVHGLPLFLLRLATEVNWEHEKDCFDGICRELGSFYASLPSNLDELTPHVRHSLFPAISTLLVPTKSLAQDAFFFPVTKLSKLYRVFERC